LKVVLVQCPVWGTREPPLALVQLSSCLKAKGHEVYSIDINNRLYRNRAKNIKTLWAWEQSLFWYNKNSVAQFFLEYKNIIDSLLILTGKVVKKFVLVF